jgi:hypothetical protein
VSSSYRLAVKAHQRGVAERGGPGGQNVRGDPVEARVGGRLRGGLELQ